MKIWKLGQTFNGTLNKMCRRWDTLHPGPWCSRHWGDAWGAVSPAGEPACSWRAIPRSSLPLRSLLANASSKDADPSRAPARVELEERGNIPKGANANMYNACKGHLHGNDIKASRKHNSTRKI